MSTNPLGDSSGIAAVLLRTAREVLEFSAEDLAEAAGCDAALVQRIEAGDLDPTLDTVERILNGSGLELRCGPGQANASYAGPEPAAGEVGRVRSALDEVRAFRAELGAPPPGPPARALPDWDGTNPAPPRPFGAAENRSDGGGWAAVLVRSAIVEARTDLSTYARDCGVDEAALERISIGATRPSVQELAGIFTRAGSGLRVRIEVYDDHDDGLHLSARTDPELHRPRRHAPATEVVAPA